MLNVDETIIESMMTKYKWLEEFRYGATKEKRYVKKSNLQGYDMKEMIDILIIRIEDIIKKLKEVDIETDFRAGADIETLEKIREEIEAKKTLVRATTYALVQVTLDIEMEIKDKQEMIAEAYHELGERIGEEFEDGNFSMIIDSLINIEPNSKGPNIVISREKNAEILVEGEYNEK